MSKKLILSAGLYRSGSTWQFNAIRLILKNSGVSYYSCWEQDYNPDNPAKYHLVKVHRFRKTLFNSANYVFTSFRDLDEIKVSMFRRAQLNPRPEFKNETRYNYISIYILDLLKYQSKSNYLLWFPHIKGQPKEEIKGMADVLGLDVDPRKINIELKTMKVPEEGFDPVTLLHSNHITNK